MPNVDPQKVFQFLSVMNAPVYAEAVTTPTMANLWNVTVVKTTFIVVLFSKNIPLLTMLNSLNRPIFDINII